MKWYLLKGLGGTDAMENVAKSIEETNKVTYAIGMNKLGKDIMNDQWEDADKKSNPDLPIYLIGGLLFLGICYKITKNM